jgi:glycosyltransferase involved in cell wall biosynthesis
MATEQDGVTERPRVVVVMPAYNAARTVGATYAAIPTGSADKVILVDDASVDDTPAVARGLNLEVIVHPENVGYGGNQKTCYRAALADGADIVVMLHPDGQYDPAIIPALIEPLARGEADLVLGSRMMDPALAIAGGMPRWKWIANRFLTWMENRVLGQQLSEYHTGYRAYTRRFLETIPYERNSPGFVFDTEVLVQAAHFKQRVKEVHVKTVYAKESSSIGFRQSLIYGIRTVLTLGKYGLHRARIKRSPLFLPRDPR